MSGEEEKAGTKAVVQYPNGGDMPDYLADAGSASIAAGEQSAQQNLHDDDHQLAVEQLAALANSDFDESLLTDMNQPGDSSVDSSSADGDDDAAAANNTPIRRVSGSAGPPAGRSRGNLGRQYAKVNVYPPTSPSPPGIGSLSPPPDQYRGATTYGQQAPANFRASQQSSSGLRPMAAVGRLQSVGAGRVTGQQQQQQRQQQQQQQQQQPQQQYQGTNGDPGDDDGAPDSPPRGSQQQKAVAEQPEHAYGLPYQDHNYGGGGGGSAERLSSSADDQQQADTSQPGGDSSSSPSGAGVNGSATSSSKTSGGQPTSSGGGTSDEVNEPFPIIGGLASYLEENDSGDERSPPAGPHATSTPLNPSHARSLSRGDAAGLSGLRTSVPYYQRAPPYSHSSADASDHSRSYVRIGGRTYIRQIAGPSSAGYRTRDYSLGSRPTYAAQNYGQFGGGPRRILPTAGAPSAGTGTYKRATVARPGAGLPPSNMRSSRVPPTGTVMPSKSDGPAVHPPAPIIVPRGGRTMVRTVGPRGGTGYQPQSTTTVRRVTRPGLTTTTVPGLYPVSSAGSRQPYPNPRVPGGMHRAGQDPAAAARRPLPLPSGQQLADHPDPGSMDKLQAISSVNSRYKELLDSPLPIPNRSPGRKAGQLRGTPVKHAAGLIDVEGLGGSPDEKKPMVHYPQRVPSPVEDVINSVVSGNRRDSKDALPRSPIRPVPNPARFQSSGPSVVSGRPPLAPYPPGIPPGVAAPGRDMSPDFSKLEDPCQKSPRKNVVGYSGRGRPRGGRAGANTPGAFARVPVSPGPGPMMPSGSTISGVGQGPIYQRQHVSNNNNSNGNSQQPSQRQMYPGTVTKVVTSPLLPPEPRVLPGEEQTTQLLMQQQEQSALNAADQSQERMQADDTSGSNQATDSSSDNDSETDSSSSDTDKEWADQDYVTRCICSLQHNDDFMISCDQCDVWQHCLCMGIAKKQVPEQYLCEQCQPRQLKLTSVQAKEMQFVHYSSNVQEKALAKRSKEKERRKQLREKRRERRLKEREKRRLKKKEKRISEGGTKSLSPLKPSSRYIEISENEYTSDAAKFVAAHSDSSGQQLLSELSETLCKHMYVASGTQGLVATHAVPPNQPVAEFRGKVCLKSECSGRDKIGRIQPHVLLYSGFASTAEDVISIDARERGSPARFARRSCRPNTSVKHVIRDGKLHILLLSTELIERGTEVTIPFDYDFRSSKFEMECACGSTDPGKHDEIEEDDVCPIKELNRDLKRRNEQVAWQLAQAKAQMKEKKRQLDMASRRKATAAAKKSKATKNKKVSAPVGKLANKKKMSAAATKLAQAKKRSNQGKKAQPAASNKKAKSHKKGAAAAQQKGKGRGRPGGLKLKARPGRKSQESGTSAAPTPAIKEEKPSFVAKSARDGRRASRDRRISSGKNEEQSFEEIKVEVIKKEPSASPVKASPGRKRTRSSNVSGAELSLAATKSPKTEAVLQTPNLEIASIVERMDYTLPSERNKEMSREERKVQQALERIQKMEELAKRRREAKETATSPATSSAAPNNNKRVFRSSITSMKKGAAATASKAAASQAQSSSKNLVAKAKSKKRGKWQRGEVGKKSPPKPTDKKRNAPKSVSEVDEDDESSSDGEMKELSSARKTVQSPKVTAPAPPRKRWMRKATGGSSGGAQSPVSPQSPVNNAGVTTRSGTTSSPSAAPVQKSSPAGGKKRWLRQAMSEESIEDAPVVASAAVVTSPSANAVVGGSPAKRRRAGEGGGADSMSSDEAAKLLTSMATEPTTPAADENRGLPGTDPLEDRTSEERAADLLISGGLASGTGSEDHAQSVDDLPARRERRKVTLDEYKKRKGPPKKDDLSLDTLVGDGSSGGGGVRSSTGGSSGQQSPAIGSSSFIPQMSDADLMESGRLHRLSSLPDPNSIGKTTATIDDLKRRIYGTGPAAGKNEAPPPPPPRQQQSSGEVQLQQEQQQQQQRMPLADRLRMEFGLVGDNDSVADGPPPPPPPPPGPGPGPGPAVGTHGPGPAVGPPRSAWGNGPPVEQSRW